MQTQTNQQHQSSKTINVKPVLKKELVKLLNGAEFVVIFSLPRLYVPNDIQVIPASGGNSCCTKKSPEKASEGDRFNNAKIDTSGLMSRCSVDSINVRSNANFCHVYVNCTAGTNSSNVGFNHWSGPYEDFVRKALSKTWRKVIKKEKDGRISIELREKVSSDNASTTILFAVE